MKLVIDIPDAEYVFLKGLKNGDVTRPIMHIQNGIPLDTMRRAIKQEIKELADYESVDALVEVMQIINKHMQEVTL